MAAVSQIQWPMSNCWRNYKLNALTRKGILQNEDKGSTQQWLGPNTLQGSGRYTHPLWTDKEEQRKCRIITRLLPFQGLLSCICLLREKVCAQRTIVRRCFCVCVSCPFDARKQMSSAFERRCNPSIIVSEEIHPTVMYFLFVTLKNSG